MIEIKFLAWQEATIFVHPHSASLDFLTEGGPVGTKLAAEAGKHKLPYRGVIEFEIVNPVGKFDYWG